MYLWNSWYKQKYAGHNNQSHFSFDEMLMKYNLELQLTFIFIICFSQCKNTQFTNKYDKEKS